MGNDKVGIQETLNYLSKNMQVKELGYPTKYVGLEIEKDDGSPKIHQESHLRKTAKDEFRQEVKTPLAQTP